MLPRDVMRLHFRFIKEMYARLSCPHCNVGSSSGQLHITVLCKETTETPAQIWGASRLLPVHCQRRSTELHHIEIRFLFGSGLVKKIKIYIYFHDGRFCKLLKNYLSCVMHTTVFIVMTRGGQYKQKDELQNHNIYYHLKVWGRKTFWCCCFWKSLWSMYLIKNKITTVILWNISNMCVTEMLRTLPYLKTHCVSTTWRLWQQYYSENKRYAFFLCIYIGRCYANLPTQRHRFFWGMFEWGI